MGKPRRVIPISELPRTVPRDFYGNQPELEFIELGARAAYRYDEGSALEHRLCKANGLRYGAPPRHWGWEAMRRCGGPLLTGGVTRSGEPGGSTSLRWCPLSRTITVQEGSRDDHQAAIDLKSMVGPPDRRWR